MISTKLILTNSSFFKETPSTTFNYIDAMKRPQAIDINLSADASDDEIPEFQNLLGSAFSGTYFISKIHQAKTIRDCYEL